MGFFDRLFKGKEVFADRRNPDMVCEITLCGQSHILSEFDIAYEPDNSSKEYMEASGLNPTDCGFAIICSDDMKLRMGQVIQSCLKENLGIDTTLESMDLATYLDVTATGDYQAAIGNYTASSLLAYSQGVYHSMSVNGSNKTRLNLPEIDALIEKVQTTLDPEENVKAVTELSDALNELCPQAPLFVRNNVRAYKKGLKGFNIDASGTTYYHKTSWE